MRRAVLAAIRLDNNSYFDETIAECKKLCEAANIKIVASIIQTAHSLDPKTAFRSGKVQELNLLIKECACDLVVFYNNLSLSQVSSLSEAVPVEIMDRTNLILDIFETRASTKEAKLQTQMARLRYSLPAKLKDYVGEDRGRGGDMNNRGSGETRASVLKKDIQGRIAYLKKQLNELKKTANEKASRRNRSGLKKVALVGYTNAGKSSLMNLLLSENQKEAKQVLSKDQLFATLDTSVRQISIDNHDLLLYDTVGFVSDLPHELVEAFRSTLDSLKEADLLIHVLDASNPYYELQRNTTLNTLKEIGAGGIPLIDVYNKADLLAEEKEGLCISCLNKEGIEELKQRIIKELFAQAITVKLFVPYHFMSLINEYYKQLSFTLLAQEEEGSWYLVKGDPSKIEHIKRQLNRS